MPSSASATVTYSEGHRWRYALVSEPIGRPCLRDDDLRLTLAGDVMLGANAEHAYLSGLAAADAIMAAL